MTLETKKFKNDFSKDYELVSDVEPTLTKDFDIKEVLKPGEDWVNGDTMVERAKEMGAYLGQRDAEWLMEHQDLIPQEHRDKYFIFPGTVWVDRESRRRYVAYLVFDGDRCYLALDCLGGDCGARARLLPLRKPSGSETLKPLGNLDTLTFSTLDTRVAKLEEEIKNIRKFLVF